MSFHLQSQPSTHIYFRSPSQTPLPIYQHKMDNPINENLCAVFFLEKKKDSPDDSQGRVPKKDADFWKLIHQLVKSGRFKILDRHAVPPDADNTTVYVCPLYGERGVWNRQRVPSSSSDEDLILALSVHALENRLEALQDDLIDLVA
ncbi:unnamed protein product [Aspergillus oryzae var. brunneus]|uniref:Unnamed protein product n=2 Tax=Aspergillus oryzae TaxID=5062 RepID=A0AAN4YW34_ASPOZ|nr:unnamed protein product [Aspergillus oryzae]GMG37846.1 unnamed protein product [Aspergillus oryzae]GMG53857.1 unnamed protein product [Aspergillus oryzae var. brunneus]